jgi:anti-sigma factor RsiW
MELFDWGAIVMSEQTKHITPDQFLDIARGRLPYMQQQHLQLHIADCAQCARLLARLIRISEAASVGMMEQAPQQIVDQAKRLMAQRKRTTQTTAHHMMAALRFDSSKSAFPHGRRAQSIGTRQLIFNTESHTLDMRIKPVGLHWVVWGQVLGDVSAGQIQISGPEMAHQELNHLGEFTVSLLASGSYSATLTMGEVVIVLAFTIE